MGQWYKNVILTFSHFLRQLFSFLLVENDEKNKIHGPERQGKCRIIWGQMNFLWSRVGVKTQKLAY